MTFKNPSLFCVVFRPDGTIVKMRRGAEHYKVSIVNGQLKMTSSQNIRERGRRAPVAPASARPGIIH